MNPVTAKQERHPAPVSKSPVLTGGSSWFEFEGEGMPHLLRMDLPVSADEMIAALYRDRAVLHGTDLGADCHVWEHAALVVALDGLNSIQDTVGEIRAQEQHGKLAAPEWLTLCRQRVADVTGIRQEQADRVDPLHDRAADTAVAETWRDAMRPEMETAWHALDRAQLVLHGEYRNTSDERIGRLKDKFERATYALIDLVIDELFPEPDDNDDEDVTDR